MEELNPQDPAEQPEAAPGTPETQTPVSDTETTPSPEEIAAQEARKRANEVAYARRKAEQAARENEELRQRLAALESKTQTQEPMARPQRPTEDQFDYDPAQFQTAMDAYEDKLVDWKLEQRETARRTEEEQRRQQQQMNERQKTFAQTRDAVVGKGMEKYEDFEDLVLTLPPDVMTQNVAEAVFATEKPEDVAYYLGKNPQEAAAVAQMNPVQMAVALGRIDAKLSVPTPKKVTNAPPPSGSVDGTGSGVIDPANLSAADYIRLRNEGKI